MRRGIFFLCFLLLGSLHVSTINKNVQNLIPLRIEREKFDWLWEIFLNGKFKLFWTPTVGAFSETKKFNWFKIKKAHMRMTSTLLEFFVVSLFFLAIHSFIKIANGSEESAQKSHKYFFSSRYIEIVMLTSNRRYIGCW